MVRTLESRRVTVMLISSSTVVQLRVKASQRVDHGRKDPHGVRGPGKVLVKDLHVLVDQGVVVEQDRKPGQLLAVGSSPLISR